MPHAVRALWLALPEQLPFLALRFCFVGLILSCSFGTGGSKGVVVACRVRRALENTCQVIEEQKSDAVLTYGRGLLQVCACSALPQPVTFICAYAPCMCLYMSYMLCDMMLDCAALHACADSQASTSRRAAQWLF